MILNKKNIKIASWFASKRTEKTRIRENCTKFWFLSNNTFDGIVNKRNVMQKKNETKEWEKLSETAGPWYKPQSHILQFSDCSSLLRSWQYADDDDHDDDDSELCAVRAQTEFHGEPKFRVNCASLLRHFLKLHIWNEKSHRLKSNAIQTNKQTERKGFTWIKCSDFWTFSIFSSLSLDLFINKKNRNLFVTNVDLIWRYQRETLRLYFIYHRWKRHLISQ